jgi:hypothetical protein
LIHFHGTPQLDRLDRDGKGVVRQRFVSRRQARQMNWPAFMTLVHTVDLDRDHGRFKFGQRPRGAHRSAFVPSQNNERADEQQQPDQHAHHRVPQAAKPTLVAHCRE